MIQTGAMDQMQWARQKVHNRQISQLQKKDIFFHSLVKGKLSSFSTRLMNEYDDDNDERK